MNAYMPDEFPAPNDRPSAPKRALSLRSWNEIKLSTASVYVIKNLIPSVGLTVVYGPPKCGKTFWLFDALMHVALGRAYRGLRTKEGPIVYCLFEGQAGFAARKKAFEDRHISEDADEPPFFLMSVRMALVAEHQALIEAVKARCANNLPVAVVLDTLNRSITGSESDDVAMTAYVAACDAIREALNCAVIIVHHSGLAAGRARGHTSLLGSADTQIGVKRDSKNNVVATVEYMKDGADGLEIFSKLSPVNVGDDDDGDPITSCIVEPCEAEDPPDVSASNGAKKQRPASQARMTFDDAFNEVATAGTTARPVRGSGPIVKAVSLDAVETEFKRRYVCDGDTPKKQSETRKKAWQRILATVVPRAYTAEVGRDGVQWIWRIEADA